MATIASEKYEPLEILAVEPGGRQVEQERHRTFAALRLRGEWFEPSEPLLTHIEGLAKIHPIPRYAPTVEQLRRYAFRVNWRIALRRRRVSR
jgi:hypothetical protein